LATASAQVCVPLGHSSLYYYICSAVEHLYLLCNMLVTFTREVMFSLVLVF